MKKTMDMKAIHYVWIICILALVGCDKEENKIGIPETIEVMADLSFIDRTTYNDPKPASLYFSLISDKGEFQHCTFSFRGKEWTFTVPVGMINLGHTYHEDDSLVTCHAVYALNNDIQAKKPKVKMLECDLSWKVSYLYENALPKQMRHEINEKKQLVISWDKLLLSDESLFSKYSLRCEGKVYEIDDINQTSIAFDDYYGQFFYIDIGAEIKDNIGVWPWDPYRIEKQEPFFTFEDTGEKRILRWDNLLNRGVNIYSNDSPTIHNYTGNELEVPYGKYGEYEKRIYFQFHTTQEQEYYDDNVIRMEIDAPISPGKYIGIGHEPVQHSYSAQNNMIYSIPYNYRYLTSWQLPSIEQTGSTTFSNQGSDAVLSAPSSSNRFAIYSNKDHTITIHEDSLDIKQLISLGADNIITAPLILTDDDKVVAFCLKDNKGWIFDIETGTREGSFDLNTDREWSKAYLSPDYKFLVYSLSMIQDLKVVKYQDLAIESEQEFSTAFTSWCVHPTQHHRLFVSIHGKTTEYDMNDMSVVNSFVIDGVDVGNIDPKTGNLVLFNKDVAVVVDPNNGQELFRTAIGDYNSRIYLYGNTLVSGMGYVYNLAPHIP